MIRLHTTIDRNYNIAGPPYAHRHVNYSPCVTWQNQIHVILIVCGVCNIYVSAAQRDPCQVER